MQNKNEKCRIVSENANAKQIKSKKTVMMHKQKWSVAIAPAGLLDHDLQVCHVACVCVSSAHLMRKSCAFTCGHETNKKQN